MRAGIDLMNTAYNYLDLTPKGRDERGRGQFWGPGQQRVRRLRIAGAIRKLFRAGSPSVVSEATAEEKSVASSESAAVAFDTTLGLLES
jgi:hypothetical protein